VARQVPLQVGFPAAPVRQDSPLPERLDSRLLERLDSAPLEHPDSWRVQLRAEPFVVAREIAQAKLA
jgi:hypothetical protein